jgi:hypothetical protein
MEQFNPSVLSVIAGFPTIHAGGVVNLIPELT